MVFYVSVGDAPHTAHHQYKKYVPALRGDTVLKFGIPQHVAEISHVTVKY
jgi:hypothetical protein